MVFFPALAIDKIPGTVCLRWKFSSKNPQATSAQTRSQLFVFLGVSGQGEPTCELLAINGLATSSISFCEITTLKHETGYHAVEGRSSISKSMFSSGEFPEVFRGLGNHIVVQLEYDATRWLIVNGDVKLKGWASYDVSASTYLGGR